MSHMCHEGSHYIRRLEETLVCVVAGLNDRFFFFFCVMSQPSTIKVAARHSVES